MPGAEEVPREVADVCVNLAHDFNASLKRRFPGTVAHHIVLVGSAEQDQRNEESSSAGKPDCGLL